MERDAELQTELAAEDVLADVAEKLASITGNRDYDKGWRDALQWVLETHGELIDGEA